MPCIMVSILYGCGSTRWSPLRHQPCTPPTQEFSHTSTHDLKQKSFKKLYFDYVCQVRPSLLLASCAAWSLLALLPRLVVGEGYFAGRVATSGRRSVRASQRRLLAPVVATKLAFRSCLQLTLRRGLRMSWTTRSVQYVFLLVCAVTSVEDSRVSPDSHCAD
jgi:hypothetical protein